MHKHQHLIALSMLPGIGPTLAKNLISFCGSPEAIFKESKKNLAKIPGIGTKHLKSISESELDAKVEQELRFVEKNKISLIPYTSSNYPRRLLQCLDAPLLLFQKGLCDLNSTRVISIVGTRRASNYGRDFVEHLLDEFKDEDIVVISGMALGIDACAHKTSLAKGLKTIGVLGHGLNHMYPSSHYSLAKEIINQGGCLLSESNSQEPIVPGNFPRRNRIIAGLCDALIVVESNVSGGSMITANIANSYNRDVFALPGRYKDKTAMGCNSLIKTHRAQLIESADDLRQQMSWSIKNTNSPPKQSLLLLDLKPEEQKVVSLLKEEESMQGDMMARRMDMKLSELASVLLELELQGIVQSLPGNVYSLN